MSRFDGPYYNSAVKWIYDRLSDGQSVVQVSSLSSSDDFPILCRIIGAPEGTADVWPTLVDYVYDKYISGYGESDGSVHLDRLPDWDRSNWKSFLRMLQGADEGMVPQLSLDIPRITSNLSYDDPKARKGLVIGDSNSGKTLNIIGLVNAVFDLGWDIVVWFVGRYGFSMEGQSAKLERYISNGQSDYRTVVRNFSQMETLPRQFHLGQRDGIKRKFLLYGMKNLKTLSDMDRWLKGPRDITSSSRVLIIDEREDRSAADVMISTDSTEEMFLSKWLEDAEVELCFKSLNYVSYISACYDIFLKRQERLSLFPIDYYVILTRGDSYVSVGDIFPISKPDSLGWIVEDGFDIDMEMNRLYSDLDRNPPEVLRDAVAWAICHTSVYQLNSKVGNYTMFIPLDRIESHVRAMTEVVFKILDDSSLPDRCEKVYGDVVSKIKCNIDSLIRSGDTQALQLLPSYDAIRGIVEARLDAWRHDSINSGIRVCYDTIDVEDNYRKYCTPRSLGHVFEYGSCSSLTNVSHLSILIAFRNSSRGLELNNVVSTYMARTLDKTDASVPMGIWTYVSDQCYIPQRIWMSSETRIYYANLNSLETDLRNHVVSSNARGIQDIPGIFKKRLDKLRFRKTLYFASDVAVRCCDCQNLIIEGQYRYEVPGPVTKYRCYDCQYPSSSRFIEGRSKVKTIAKKMIPILLSSRFVSTEKLESMSGLEVRFLTKELFKNHYVIVPDKDAGYKFIHKKDKKPYYTLIYCPLLVEFFKDLRVAGSSGLDDLYVKYLDSWNWIFDHAAEDYSDIFGHSLLDFDIDTSVYVKDDKPLFIRCCLSVLERAIDDMSGDRFKFHYAKQYAWIQNDLYDKNRNMLMQEAIERILSGFDDVELIGPGLLQYQDHVFSYKVYLESDKFLKGVVRIDGELSIYVADSVINVVTRDGESDILDFFHGCTDPTKDEISLICRLVAGGL